MTYTLINQIKRITTIEGIEMKRYAVVQNGYAIFGEGNTIDEAVADANANLDDDLAVSFEEWSSETLLDFTNGRSPAAMIGDMYITDDHSNVN